MLSVCDGLLHLTSTVAAIVSWLSVVELVFVTTNFGTFLTRFLVFHRVLFTNRGREVVAVPQRVLVK